MLGSRTKAAALATLAATFIAFAATDSAANVCAGETVPDGEVVKADTKIVWGCEDVNKVRWTTGSPVASGETVCDVRGFATFTLPDDFIITDRWPPSKCMNWPPSPAAKPQDMIIRSPTTGVFHACPGSKPPVNYVVTYEAYTYPCEDNHGNGAGFIVEPADPDGISTCAYRDPPPGYVVTYYTADSAGCGLYSGGVRRTIKKPKLSQSTNICQPFRIPDGFAVTGDGTYQNCNPAGSGTGPGLTIAAAVSGSYTCSTNGIPSTLVINSIGASTICSSGRRYNLLQPPTGGTVKRACYPSQPPTGFVIVGETSADMNCYNGPSSSIRTPLVNPPSDLYDTVCQSSRIPDGFVTTSTLPEPGYSCYDGVFHIRLMQPDDVVNACPDSPIPDGFVFTEGAIVPCGNNGDFVTGLTISPAVNGAWSCSETLPAGFVIGQIANDSRCSGGKKYLVVDPPRNGDTTFACTPSVAPSDFVITSRDLNNSMTCLGEDLFGIRVPPVGETLTVCLDSPIPDGFVITGYAASPAICEGDASVANIGPPDPDGGNVCEGSPIPLGYVVTYIGNNIPYCGLNGGIGNGLSIQLPNDPGTTVICLVPEAPIPAGFVPVSSNGPQPDCGGAEQVVIEPEVGEPQPFIDLEPDVTGPPAPVPIDCTADGTGGLVDNASRNTAVCAP